jgi:tetratricopeptide (TPR) repeat protein
LGKVNESRDAYGKPSAFLKEDLKKSPNDAEAWLRKAGALRSPNRQEKAAVAYNKSLEAFDHRKEEALAAFDEALMLNPSDIYN